MAIKIWNRMNWSDGKYIHSCARALPEKYTDVESASKALTELAEHNFYFGKYKMKKIIEIEKVNDRKYIIFLDGKYDVNEETYEVGGHA